MLKIVLVVLAVLLIAATGLPFLQLDDWWIRVFDFPRAQIALAGLFVIVVFLFVWKPRVWWESAVLGALVLSVLYQGTMMFPYSPLASRQVEDADGHRPDSSVTLLIANVLMDNRASDRLLALVREHNPDVVLTVETDSWWEQQLRVLEEEYTYTVKHPLDNTYGMLLHSRLELVSPEVSFLVEPDIPSMHTWVVLPSGIRVRLHCVHPRPPAPSEAEDTTERDAELLLVGKMVAEHDRPTVVAGDLNDVAWSHTTGLFQEISGLLDPRIGRGMYNSFNAKYVFMRWPLDHVFHSEHFKLVSMQRLPAWGSDHFAILVTLQYDSSAPAEQDKPDAELEDRQEAEEKIDKAQSGGQN